MHNFSIYLLRRIVKGEGSKGSELCLQRLFYACNLFGKEAAEVCAHTTGDSSLGDIEEGMRHSSECVLIYSKKNKLNSRSLAFVLFVYLSDNTLTVFVSPFSSFCCDLASFLISRLLLLISFFLVPVSHFFFFRCFVVVASPSEEYGAGSFSYS